MSISQAGNMLKAFEINEFLSYSEKSLENKTQIEKIQNDLLVQINKNNSKNEMILQFIGQLENSWFKYPLGDK